MLPTIGVELCSTLGSGPNALETTRRTGHIYLEGPARRNLKNGKQSGPSERPEPASQGLLRLGQPPSRRSHGSHPCFHLRDSPRKFSNLLHDYKLFCFCTPTICSPCIQSTSHRTSSLPALRPGATAHLYANYFATWTKVIMLSDRKLTGLKSEMEINKLAPLNDGARACVQRPAWRRMWSLH